MEFSEGHIPMVEQGSNNFIHAKAALESQARTLGSEALNFGLNEVLPLVGLKLAFDTLSMPLRKKEK